MEHVLLQGSVLTSTMTRTTGRPVHARAKTAHELSTQVKPDISLQLNVRGQQSFPKDVMCLSNAMLV